MLRRTLGILCLLLIPTAAGFSQGIATQSLPDGKVGVPYSFTLTAVNGVPPYKWSLAPDATSTPLPPGLTLNATTGEISGIPTTAGTYNPRFQVVDSRGNDDKKGNLFLTILPGALSITTASPLPDAKIGLAYSQTLSASGGTTPYQWSIASGTLPVGISLNGTSGVLSGTATATGAAHFTITVTDATGATATKAFDLTSSVPVVSCTLNPQNMYLALHRPEYHTTGGHPDHILTARLTVDGVTPPPSTISIAASGIVFAPPSGAANATRASASTNSSGQAAFIVNPPASSSFDTTQLTATGSALGQSFSCSGTIVVGAGTISTLIQRQIKTAMAGSVLPQQYAEDYDRFAEEVWRILARHPDLQPAARQLRDRIDEAKATAELKGQSRPLNSAEMNQAFEVVDAVRAEASPELRRAIERWRRDLAQTRLRFVAQKPPKRPVAPQPNVAADLRTGTKPSVSRVPLTFEPNRGQAPTEVQYLVRGPVKSAFLTRSGVRFAAASGAGFEMQMVGARRIAAAPDQPLASRSHYLTVGAVDVPHYRKLRYPNVYPGTDLVFYGDQGRLRYDFVLAPGADPGRIRLRFQGAESVEPGDGGAIVLRHPSGRVLMEKPVVYQEDEGGRREIVCRYSVKGRNLVAFELGDYDRGKRLVIDPVLLYSSYLGGAADEAGVAIAVDAQGSAYIAGSTASLNYPGRNGASPTGFTGTFITKLTPDGSGVVYSTYIGGNGVVLPSGIAVDSAGNAYVCGLTTATNFPVKGPYQTSLADRNATLAGDAFVLKLNASGSALLYSTYIGGSKFDIAKSIAVDAAGNAYLTGSTASADFPIKGGLQTALHGGKTLGTDAFALKLDSSGGSLVYSTFLGGTGDDYANAIALDSTGNAYITGMTYSTDFPAQGKLQTSSGGGLDAFVTKLNASGSAIVYSTYLGGESDDQAFAIAVDTSGSAYVAGMTGSAKFPTVAAAQAKPGSSDGTGFDAFLSKLAPDGNSLVYSTYLGGSGTDVAQGIALGTDGSAYVTGETDSADFPVSVHVTSANGAMSDAFVAKLTASGAAFEYTTRIGGSGMDTGAAIALDRAGNVFVAGSSFSPDQPVTYGSFQGVAGGLADALALKIGIGTPGPSLALTSAAAFVAGQAGAPLSIESAFGTGLATQLVVAPPALAQTLGGVSVTVKDSAGVSLSADLYFVAPGQINFVVPAGTATGLAQIGVQSGSQTSATSTLRIQPVAPALFSANSDGRGPAAAIVLRVAADGTQTSQVTFACGALAGSCANTPIDLATGQQTYLLLFGSGIRGRTSLANVSATVGGVTVPVAYAGDQGQFAGFDQVNLGPLPASLSGKSSADVLLTVDGVAANGVTVGFK